MLPAVTNLKVTVGATTLTATWDDEPLADAYLYVVDVDTPTSVASSPLTLPLPAPGAHTLSVVAHVIAGSLAETAFTVPQPPQNDGIFCYAATTKTVVPESVIGLSFINTWADCEPSPGVYDWTAVNACLDYATTQGKRAMNRIMVGAQSPAWAKAECPTVTISFQPGGPMPAQTIAIPIPWNAKRLQLVCAMIAAYGAEFDGHPALARVPMPGCGWLGEMALPAWAGWLSSAPVPRGCGIDVYTDAKLIDAWNTIIDAYVVAFPHTELTVAIDGNSNIPPTSMTETALRAAINEHAASAIGARIVFQQNGLSEQSSPASFATYAQYGKQSGGGIGLQQYQGNNTLANFTTMSKTALAVTPRFVEVYASDCVNPALAAELAVLAAGIK